MSARVWSTAGLACLFVLLAASCCSRSANHRPSGSAASAHEQEEPPAPPPDRNGGLPWIELMRTGGIAGFRQKLVVLPDGSWTAEDLAHRKVKNGRLSSADLDSLKQTVDDLPPDAWGTFPSEVVDDFHYEVSVRFDDIIMRMDGGGSGLPDAWKPFLRQAEKPLPELYRD